jgi:hypothetical protein
MLNILLFTPQQEQVLDLIRILYGILMATLFLFGAELLSRYMKADKDIRSDPAYMVFFVISMAVIGYALYMVLAIINYDLITDAKKSDGTIALQVLFVVFILVGLSWISEKIIFKKLKISPTLVFGGISIIYSIVLTILEFSDPNIVAGPTLYYPILALFFILGIIAFLGIIIIFFVKLRPQKAITRKIMWGLIIGIIGLAGSFYASTGRADANIHYVIGTIIEIIGWLGLRHYILSIPSYSELEWRNGMIEMHVIMAETGISLYFRTFRRISPHALKGDLKVEMTIPEEERPNTDLIGGGMIGIKTMLGEIAGTKGKLESIQIGEKYLNFKTGDNIMVLLLTDMNLGVYQSLLLNTVQEIEAKHPGLADFNGDTRQLHIAEIVDRFFGEEKKK